MLGERASNPTPDPSPQAGRGECPSFPSPRLRGDYRGVACGGTTGGSLAGGLQGGRLRGDYREVFPGDWPGEPPSAAGFSR